MTDVGTFDLMKYFLLSCDKHFTHPVTFVAHKANCTVNMHADRAKHATLTIQTARVAKGLNVCEEVGEGTMCSPSSSSHPYPP